MGIIYISYCPLYMNQLIEIKTKLIMLILDIQLLILIHRSLPNNNYNKNGIQFILMEYSFIVLKLNTTSTCFCIIK